jgi:hypothetical protein
MSRDMYVILSHRFTGKNWVKETLVESDYPHDALAADSTMAVFAVRANNKNSAISLAMSYLLLGRPYAMTVREITLGIEERPNADGTHMEAKPL